MLTMILAFIATHAGLFIAGGAGASVLLSTILPKILGFGFVQKGLGYFLQTATWVALPFAKWLKLGPLKHLAVVPLFALQVAGAWFMRFNDKVLGELDDSARVMAKALADALAKVGSVDQQHYYNTKNMTQEQVDLVQSMAKAVVNQCELVPEDQAVLDRALEAGKALMAARNRE